MLSCPFDVLDLIADCLVALTMVGVVGCVLGVVSLVMRGAKRGADRGGVDQ